MGKNGRNLTRNTNHIRCCGTLLSEGRKLGEYAGAEKGDPGVVRMTVSRESGRGAGIPSGNNQIRKKNKENEAPNQRVPHPL